MPKKDDADSGLGDDQKFAAFKFYEEAAEKTKAHAWSQTTWILALNAGILAFSLQLYVEHASAFAFIPIEIICALVGIALCVPHLPLARVEWTHRALLDCLQQNCC
jgi:hypothetical protein